MATIKSYTDLSQSKKLAKILPLESADMYFNIAPDEGYSIEVIQDSGFIYHQFENTEDFNDCQYLPCWSLAALLEQFPYELCDDDGNSVYLEINKEDDLYQLVYTDPYGDFKNIETDRYEHFVDACVAMIEKLNELKML